MDFVSMATPKEISPGEWETHQVKIGETYRLTYRERFFTTQGQIDTVMADMARDPRWKIVDYTKDGQKHIFTLRILENPFPLALVIAAVAASAVSVFVFLSLDKIEQIAGPFAGPSILLIAGALAFMVFKGRI